MQLGNTVHFNSFKWVKEELRQILQDVQRQLEEYVNCPEDEHKLDEIIIALRQVRGTLSLVEIYGAALLSEEMEMVARALKSNEIANRDNAFEVLLNSSIKLPDYLDSLASGNKDVPMVLLPLLNDLRACRNASLLSENVLFFPDVSAAADIYDSDTEEIEIAKSQEDIAEIARKSRHLYQLGLLGWFRNNIVEEAFKRMEKVIRRLRAASRHDRTKRLWWISLTIIESLQHDGVESSVALKSLMGKVDRQIKSLADMGEDDFVKQLPDQLTKNLLYYVAQSKPVTNRIKRVQQTFNLNKYLPNEQDLAHAERSLGGPNQELLDKVSVAILEDINQAKDALEVYLHGDRSDFDQIEVIIPMFSKIADTLGMLGLGRARENIVLERSQLEASVTAKSVPAEEVLMSAASALLGVESDLDAYVNRRVSATELAEADTAGEESEQSTVENQRVLGSLVNEALKNITMVKDGFLTYIEDPANLDSLKGVPDLLSELSGAMFVAPLDEARGLINGLTEYFHGALIKDKREPGPQEQDVFADVVTNIECFLEAVAENRIDSEMYVASGDEALKRLSAFVDGSATETLESIGSDLQALADDLKPDLTEAEKTGPHAAVMDVDQVSQPPARPRSTRAVVKDYSTLQVIGEDADEEIIEVFIEEAIEELGRISNLFPVWRENLSDRESLTTLRRSFHTLKGSGRLIGATAIGEFSWAMENMLNRVIDGAIKESRDVLNTIEEAIAVLPQLIEQIRGMHQEPIENIFELMQQADAIATGQPLSAIKEQVAAVSQSNDKREPDVPKESHAEVGTEAPASENQVEESPLADEDSNANEGDSSDEADTSLAPPPSPQSADDITFEMSDLLADDDDDDLGEDGSFAIEDLLSDDDDNDIIIEADSTADEATLVEAPSNSDVDEILAPSGSDVDEILTPSDSDIDETLVMQEADEALIVDDDDAAFSAEELIESASESEPGSELEPETEPEHAFNAELGSDADAELDDFAFDDDLGLQTDPALLKIFSDEAEHHLGELDRISKKARLGSMPSKEVEVLIRALHTLHGSARTAKFMNIAEKAKMLENHANNLSEMGRHWANNELDLLDRTVTYIRQCVAYLREHTQELISDSTLDSDLAFCVRSSNQELELIIQEKMNKTGYVEPVELDTELVEIFLEEAPDLVGSVEQSLLEWKKSNYNPAHITEIMRHLHTLKGSARMASLSDIGDLSHALESLFIAISSNKLPSNESVTNMLTDAVDRLMGMMDVLAQGRFPTVSKEYLQSLEDVRLWRIEPEDTLTIKVSDVEQRLAEDDAKGAVQEEVDAAEVPTVVEFPQDIGLPAVPDADDMQVQVEQTAAAAPQQEQIRVRADKLDSLVNFAGEVNIYHSRLGQHVSDVRFNLSELEQTVVRLRGQLRDMEIQTEAQIASRMEREQENPYEEFDPLEMDRYSHMQQLSRSLSESAGDLDSISEILSDLVHNSEMVLQQQSRVSTDLQEELLQTRMVRFQGLASRLRRIVRQTALQLDKKVELNIVGADNEIDRTVQERMLAPLEHMLRNAVFHGIETPDQRSAAGKQEIGTIRLEIARDGSFIVLNVADDGAGIDINRVKRKAIESGMLQPDETKSNQEIMQLILHDGFSTAEDVSQIAGRGVGLDVVDTEIKQLGGSLVINSEPGRGTIFSVRLPLTLAINQALLVQLADDIYAIPLAAIEGVVLLSRNEVEENLTGKRKDYEYAGNSYDMYYLGNLLGLGLPSSLAAEGQFPLLLVHSGGRRVGVHMDAMIGRREIVVKPVGPQITAIPGISGATILADGRVALILDIAGLIRSDTGETTFTRSQRTTLPFNKPDDELTVMVVDDSITIRKVTARILGRHGLKVITAKDGLDAVQQLQELTPDLFLMDIEMPRMDGFELATHVRSDARLQGVPIIMITSRTGEKHRERAKQIGVDRYLGKPFQENELMLEINELLDRIDTA